MREDLYFIRCATGPVKIGKARWVDGRLRMLQCGTPHKLQLIGTLPARGFEEADWHREFEHLRIRGEWFEWTDELAARIDQALKDHRERELIAGDPEHPGGWIRRNMLEANRLNVSEAARRMGINRPAFIAVLDGKRAVSRDLAYRLEALTGIDADLLLGMQRGHDRAQNQPKRERFAREIERVSETA